MSNIALQQKAGHRSHASYNVCILQHICDRWHIWYLQRLDNLPTWA